MRRLLLPFSFLYWIVVWLRNWFFDKGILNISKITIPVISVGNISTGGVGKTPVVEMLIEILLTHKSIAIVSRGYGRKSKGLVVVSRGKGTIVAPEIAGDESSQIAEKYTNEIVIVDENRVRAAQKAIELGANIILLDDGFQHQYLHRDVNIVVLSVEEIIQGDFLLPAGNRREPLRSLQRADMLMISRCRSVEEFESAKKVLIRKLKCLEGKDYAHSFLKGEKIVAIQTTAKSLRDLMSKQQIEINSILNKRVVLFSGIGNPKSFEELVANAGIIVARHLVFSDHHWFSEKEIQEIVDAKRQLNAEFILTTEKDAARLGQQIKHLYNQENILVVIIQNKIIDGKAEFDKILERFVN
jgi:tetraacyldisaccharide 4'-kinase